MVNSRYQMYQNNSVMTATPGELTYMLYNGAVRFCIQAIEMIENQDIEKSNEYILKAQNIIVELQATLDMKYPIAQQFDQIYDYIKYLLVEANIYKDKEKLELAKEFIIEFRDTWKQIINK